MSEDKKVLVVGGMRGGMGRQVLMSKYIRLFLHGKIEVPDSKTFKSRDRVSKISPRQNKKMPPHKTILRNHR